ncbi:hypothetical protein GCM10009133_14510 [Cocleimonas flava]|uniref:Uncharacterized protein n=1 Tax=Cocleimonas flava TaxID=634765 RepID=A0A4R1F5G2_9GAMM|nr:hypothetical protein [Cocleimonas flava]TCJ87819.1 hypothetical protein EV695_2334 [Cocleimonas flava]
MHVLTTEQQKLLSIVLMEYFNVRDWKDLFQQTDSETYAQQHTHFYDEESWDNGSYEDNLEKDCAKAVAFILNKDGDNLKVIWEMPGVKTMSLRKDENFHAEIEAIIEDALEKSTDKQTAENPEKDTDSYANLPDENQNPYETLDAAQELLDSNSTAQSIRLIHAALKNFLQQTCKKLAITTDDNDSISILQAKVNEHLKQQNSISQKIVNLNDSSLSMLRTTTLLTETIDDLSYQNKNENHVTNSEVKYAINITRSVMIYIDELVA